MIPFFFSDKNFEKLEEGLPISENSSYVTDLDVMSTKKGVR